MSVSLRQRVYAGEIVQMSPTPATRALRDSVLALLEPLAGGDPRELHERLQQEELMAALGAVQRTVRTSDALLAAAARVVAAAGESLEGLAIDTPRLRAVTPDGHTRPEALAAYAIHRDTWYANSQSQLNWWVPLYDVSERDSFRIYPSYFAQPIANTSEGFDFSEWLAKVGWQTRGKAALAAYPMTREPPDEAGAIDVVAPACSLLVFSAQHLHGTLPNHSKRIRYSVDFRTVCRDDHARELGAPRVDNFARGNALDSYRDAASLAEGT